MKRIKKIIFIVLTSILGLLLTFNIYNFFCTKVLKQDLATINGYAILEVVSGSMEPTIHVGDLIVINTKEESYKENDIVTFYDVEGSFVTHRIMSINDDKMITQGDNNNSEDEEMPIDSIVGKHVITINGLGNLIKAFKSPFVLIMILVIGVLFCVFISLDKDGNPIIDEEDKEFQEYLKNKEENSKLKTNVTASKKASSKKEEVKPKKGPSNTKPKTSGSKATTKKTSQGTKKQSPKKGESKKTNTTKKTTDNKKKSTTTKKK